MTNNKQKLKQMEQKIVQSGWTVLTDVMDNGELVQKVEDNGVYISDIYETEKDVQKSIDDDLMEQLHQK